MSNGIESAAVQTSHKVSPIIHHENTNSNIDRLDHVSGSISLSVTKLLWGRNGNRCSMPDCRQELIAKQTGSDPPVPVGEMAHIAGKKLDSPRYDSGSVTSSCAGTGCNIGVLDGVC